VNTIYLWPTLYLKLKILNEKKIVVTFARPAGTILSVDVDADAISSVVLRRRIVAVATPELETVGAARRPRRPRVDVIKRFFLRRRRLATFS
jgi:hypothetical protein